MKRALNTPNPKSLPTHKNKTKQHSKTKDKKFNPLEYLNSLIDEIHDHRYDTARKKITNTHRLERSSALAYTTPITERTVASSKVRSKSSYSQYRKKSILPLRDILRVDIDRAITEEDNFIHFTEETLESPQYYPSTSQVFPHKQLTPVAAARRIQRAWRKFQTLKVLSKYYKNVVKREQKVRQIKEEKDYKEKRVDHRREFQRTLKIKKTDQGGHNRTVRMTLGGNAERLEFSQEASSNITKELVRQPAEHQLHEAKTLELPIREAEVFSSEEYTSKDLKFVIDLFRSREETASKEINNQLEAYCQMQAQLTPLDCFTSNHSQTQLSPQRNQDPLAEGLSPLVFQEMEKVTREKYELMMKRVKAQDGERDARQMEQIQGRMRRELRGIERCREDYMRSIRQLKENMMKLQQDSSKIQRLYQEVGRVPPKIRKSYSAETLILKSILEEVNFRQFDIDCKGRKELPLMLEECKAQDQMHPICPTSPPSGINPAQNNSQTGCSKDSLGCYEFSDSDRLQEQIYNGSASPSQHSPSSPSSPSPLGFEQELSHCESSSSVQVSLRESSMHSEAKEDMGSVLLRECAQQLQSRIQTILLGEIIQEVFLTPKMYLLFKPYIEHSFQFKQITDQDILNFLNIDLPKFFPPAPQLLSRINQKINPNTLQILRLIRDFDFEIDQYELILPEEVFKAYRRTVEQEYAVKIRKEAEERSGETGLCTAQNSSWVSERVRGVVEERGAQRRARRAKFLGFQRDLKIMYMKSVFNCYNELIIETKSFYSFMNARSSIGPGELTLALKEYNWQCDTNSGQRVLRQAASRVFRVVRQKAMLPTFRNYKQLQEFQKQVNRQLTFQLTQGEFKWVNYMDQVLEIWQELASDIIGELLGEAVGQLLLLQMA